MHVALASCSDIPALADLLAFLFEQEVEFLPDRDAQMCGLTRILENPHMGSILVVKQQDSVVGMVSLLYSVSTALGERVALLEDMVILPTVRNTGIGSQLLQAAIDHARTAGCKRITLLTDHTNEAAQRFYAKQGFSISTMVPLRLSL